MTDTQNTPGISRDDRISDTGLSRLEAHLQSGAKISPAVLEQWVKRYGDSAQQLIDKHQNKNNNELDN